MRGESVLQIQRGIGVGVHESLGFDSAVFDVNACTEYSVYVSRCQIQSDSDQGMRIAAGVDIWVRLPLIWHKRRGPTPFGVAFIFKGCSGPER